MAIAVGMFVVAGARSVAQAQVHPGLEWRTLRTEEVRVHFTLETEDLAYRTLANALWAYRRLALELPTPRGVVDIVVADNADWANGYATPYPSNRIVIYARPPVDEPALRNHVDWNRLVVTHEMAHIFQLDRVGGWWKLAQRVFGRAAPLFPHTYAPNWLLEGVAVHYETRLTGAGRLAGAEYPAAVRALALEDALPPLDAIVTGRPFYPAGNTPYLLGAYIAERAVRLDPQQTPAEAMARLFERMSGRINPWRLDKSAREAFGTSFTDIYNTWRDSVYAATRSVASPAFAEVSAGAANADGDAAAGSESVVRVVAPANWVAEFPRYAADGSLFYVADNQRQTPSLCHATPSGQCNRSGRRNSVDANTFLEDGLALSAEYERRDPYTIRSDLYVQRGVWHRAFTRGERLAHPDAHVASGRIVAIQTRPGTTDLVLLDRAYPFPRTLAAGSLTRNWTEPRLSNDGTRIAAVRWDFGGRTSVVLMDSTGREFQRFAPRATDREGRLAIVSAPVWLPGDTTILFASDHDGVPSIYRGDVRSGAYAKLWRTATALRHPSVSPDGREIAAVELRAEGWAVVARPMPVLRALPAGPPPADTTADRVPLDDAPPLNPSLERYQPGLTAHPMWWLPAIESTVDASANVGFLAGGVDVVGRHRWNLTYMRDVKAPRTTIRAGYDYAGLGNPVLSASYEDVWSHGAVTNTSGARVGTLSRYDRTATLSAFLSRPRVRLSTYAVVATELVLRTYQTDPEGLLQLLGSQELLDMDLLPRVALVTGFSTMQRPGLSVSVEDGVAGQVLLRRRFAEGRDATATNEAIAELSVAKSLPFPGFARHVLALRAAHGATGIYSNSLYDIGGVSGGSLTILPGYALGSERRNFFVRGFRPGAQVGNRAASAHAEYRAPLTRVGRGVGLMPANVQKLSLIGFADAGSAWCSERIPDSRFCGLSRPGQSWIASAGGELIFDVALQYDVLYRIRLGYAAPVHGGDAAITGRSVYLTFGSTF